MSLISKERIELLRQVYFSHHPDGTEEEFWKRMDKIYDMEERAMDRLQNGYSILKLLGSKGRNKKG